jgi:hypothetical protein
MSLMRIKHAPATCSTLQDILSYLPIGHVKVITPFPCASLPRTHIKLKPHYNVCLHIYAKDYGTFSVELDPDGTERNSTLLTQLDRLLESTTHNS